MENILATFTQDTTQIIIGRQGKDPSMDDVTIYDFLAQLAISYEEISHPAVYTVDEAKTHREGMEQATHAKNLFLKDSRRGRYYLVSLQADRDIRLKELRKRIGAKKLSFSSPEELEEILGVEPGSVSPLALIHDKGGEVTYVIDNMLWEADLVAYHPNVNTRTLLLSGIDFQKIILEMKYEPVILDLD